mmetsp:Transcript_35622/g.40037  ORF Transcript_35622/g.40037 Transcript_35622/m.40037 type:complete len:109 (+) Transcript_35622:1229-1555(+)
MMEFKQNTTRLADHCVPSKAGGDDDWRFDVFFFFAAVFVLADDVGLGLVDFCGSTRVDAPIAPNIFGRDGDWLGFGSGVASYFWNSTTIVATSREPYPGIAAASVALL